jgi:hypothetical protein
MFLAILAGVGDLEAQALRAGDRGAAMLTRPISSKAELAEAFRNCETSPLLRASCQQYLEAFQIVDPDGAPQSVAQLPAYVMDLALVPCPSGRGILSRIFMPSRKMDHAWPRDFEVGEMCLVNNNTNRLVLSMACGNTVLSPRTVAMQPLDRPREMSLTDNREVKDTNRITVPKGTLIRGNTNIVLDSNVVLTTREPTALVITTVDTTSSLTVKDTIRVSVADSVRIKGPVMGSRLLTSSGVLVGPQSVVVVDFGQPKKQSFLRKARDPAIGVIVGLIAGYLIFHGDDCGCPSPKSGGPVNPPN